MPHAPPPPNSNGGAAETAIGNAVIVGLPLFFFTHLVMYPILYMFPDYNQTDLYFIGFTVFALCIAGVIAESYIWITYSFEAVVRLRAFAIVFLASLTITTICMFAIPLEIIMENDDELIVVESVGVKLLQCLLVSFLVACLVFTFTLFQQCFLVLRYKSIALAMDMVGRFNHVEPVPHQTPATGVPSLNQKVPDFDVDWSVFEDAPADLKAAYDREMDAAERATDPLQIQHHLKSAKLLITKMTTDPKLLAKQKLLMIEDQRSRN